MSSNRNLSDKEREILERQRALAASLKPAVPPAIAAAAARPRVSKKAAGKGSLSLPPRPSAQSSKEFIDLTDSPVKAGKRPSTRQPAPSQTRPSKKRALVRRQTPQALLAAARSRAASAPSPNDPPSSYSTVSNSDAKKAPDGSKPSPKLKRKTISKEHPSASLAKLVQHVSTTASSDPLNDHATIPTIRPDDFWKHLRSWDFVSEYASLMRQQQQQSRASKEASAEEEVNEIAATKPLPNVFLNPRHYIAAWAPLCLAECRAQILQEAMTSRNLTSPPILVSTESTNNSNSRPRNRRNNNRSCRDSDNDAPWMDETETGGHVLIRPKDRNAAAAGSELNFMSNDLCLLIHPDYPTILSDIQRGVARPPNGSKPDAHHAYGKVGLIGHTETPRKNWTTGGLVLKVSKRRWAVMGHSDMLLVKLGSNVTALREFTALCRVDTLPLKRYLLGLHLEKAENRRKLSSRQSTEQLLGVLGGTQQLGPGFVKYCQEKFNTSQLTAIAASANQYGEGGFTLIKGPPGTGS